MKIGSKVYGMLLVSSDDKKLKNTDLETALSVQISSLKTAIYNEGLEIYNLGAKRYPEFTENSEIIKQIRQDFVLILTKKLSKDDVYILINSVRAQPLKFK